MPRIKDTVNLFGLGIGSSTVAEIKCGMCKTIHNKGMDPDEGEEGVSILNTEFAGITVAECCFEKIENEILHRMDDIIPWYRDHVKLQREIFETKQRQLNHEVFRKHPADCMACEHANENPAICPCPPTCYCQSNTCKNRPDQARKNPDLFRNTA